MSKFKIDKITPAYSPQVVVEPTFVGIDNLKSQDFEKSDSLHKIYITPEAQKVIFSHIGWATQTPQNVVEQGGILIGNTFIDPTTKVQYAVIQNAIAGEEAKGSTIYLEMGHEVWKKMIDQADQLLDANPQADMQIIGWYHTHPNNLSVFMSGTDLGTQQKFFSQEWQYAIVLNPHRQVWKAFYGHQAIQCQGIMLAT